MRYETLITRNLALLDLPVEKYGQVKQKRPSYLHQIFRKLLVYDQLPDDDLASVLRETKNILETPDPAFETLFHNQFEQFINENRHSYTWGKVRKDYSAYIRAEVRRRNSENPYFNTAPQILESWDSLPNFSRQKSNQPWQFDSLCRDAQALAGEIHELIAQFADPEQKPDRDLFRAKVNSILVPERIIYALNSHEGSFGFAENQITLANIKLSLDGYKVSHTFLNRSIEALHKVRWSSAQRGSLIDQAITFADRLAQKLKLRISELERRFMLFVEAIEEEHRAEP